MQCTSLSLCLLLRLPPAKETKLICRDEMLCTGTARTGKGNGLHQEPSIAGPGGPNRIVRLAHYKSGCLGCNGRRGSSSREGLFVGEAGAPTTGGSLGPDGARHGQQGPHARTAAIAGRRGAATRERRRVGHLCTDDSRRARVHRCSTSGSRAVRRR